MDYRKELIKGSFYVAYVFLVTTGTITFIEALRANNPVIRHIMNLETCISIIAAFFYSTFVDTIKQAESQGEALPYEKINLTRYTDWFISTPFMLFVLCMVLAYESKVKYKISILAVVLLLNVCMLGVGYMGETNKLDRKVACGIGFIFFTLMFGFIWLQFMHGHKQTFGASLTFYMFLVIWSFYGVVYLLDEESKNICYNVLDTFAKAVVGIFFWMYFTKSIII